MTRPEAVVLGIDPGRKKCGLAVLSVDGRVLARRVLPLDDLPQAVAALVATQPVRCIVVGAGTGSDLVLESIQHAAAGGRIVVRDERNTTLAARRRYWVENPPSGLWRLVPTTLRVPPKPHDDLVAVILAEEWLRDDSRAREGTQEEADEPGT